MGPEDKSPTRIQADIYIQKIRADSLLNEI